MLNLSTNAQHIWRNLLFSTVHLWTPRNIKHSQKNGDRLNNSFWDYSKLTVRVWHRIVEHKILCSETTRGPVRPFSMIDDFTQGIFHKNCKPLPSITSSHDLIATSIDDSNVETSGMKRKRKHDFEFTVDHLICAAENSSLDVLSTIVKIVCNMFLLKTTKLLICRSFWHVNQFYNWSMQ